MTIPQAKISKVTGVLLLLFAISVLISQSAMDLFSTMLCFYMAWAWYQNRRSNQPFHPVEKMGFDWLWVAWFVVAMIGFLLNTPPPETPPHFWLVRLVEYKWIFILYFMVGAFHASRIDEENFKWFNWMALLLSVYAIVDYLINVMKAADPNPIRLGGAYQFAMTYAHVYVIFFCLLLGFCLEAFKSLSVKKRWFYVGTMTLMGLSIVLTYTRGVWIAGFIAVMAMGFLSSFKKGLIAFVSGIAIAGLLYVSIPTIRGRVQFTERMANAESAKGSYDNERVILWKTNLMIFRDHPLFGSGYGQNKYLLHSYYEKQGLPKDQFIGHAHNQYLHLLAGTGIFGLLCYLGVLGILAWMTLMSYLRIPKSDGFHKGLALGALGAQIAFAIGGLTESNFEHSKGRFGIMFAWAIGLWLWQSFGRHSTTQARASQVKR